MNRRAVGFAGGLVSVAIVCFIFLSNRGGDTTEPSEADTPAVLSTEEPADDSPGSRIPRDVFPDLNANQNIEEDVEYPADECARLENAFDENVGYIDDRIEEVREYGIEVLKGAAGAEYLWAGAILSWQEDRDATHMFLERGLKEHPEFYPIAALAVRECGRYGTFCEYFTDDKLLGRAEVNEDVATWVNLAKHFTDLGDDDRALDAVRRAAAAPKFSDQTLPNIRVAQRSLAVIGDFDEWERAAGGLGMGIQSAEPVYVPACSNRSQESDDWLQACILLAERLAFDAGAGLNRMAGLGMLSRLYPMAGREDDVAALTQDLEQVMAGMSTLESWADRVALARDEQLLNEYLERWNDADDPLGLKYLQSEVERKIESGEYPALTDCVE